MVVRAALAAGLGNEVMSRRRLPPQTTTDGEPPVSPRLSQWLAATMAALLVLALTALALLAAFGPHILP